MKKYFNLALIVIGMIVFLGGLFLYGLGVHEIIPVPRQDLLPWSTSILGILFYLLYQVYVSFSLRKLKK